MSRAFSFLYPIRPRDGLFFGGLEVTDCDWLGGEMAAFERDRMLFRDVSADYVAARHGGELAYLATPYSKLCRDRSGGFNRSASITCVYSGAYWQRAFALRGLSTVSPIVMAGLIAESDMAEEVQEVDPLNAPFWENWCRPMLEKADLVVVPQIDGWRDSLGVWCEVQTALARDVPVFLVSACRS